MSNACELRWGGHNIPMNDAEKCRDEREKATGQVHRIYTRNIKGSSMTKVEPLANCGEGSYFASSGGSDICAAGMSRLCSTQFVSRSAGFLQFLPFFSIEVFQVVSAGSK